MSYYRCFATNTTFNLSRLPPTRDSVKIHQYRTYLQVLTLIGYEKKILLIWAGNRILMTNSSHLNTEPVSHKLYNFISCRCKIAFGTKCSCKIVGLVGWLVIGILGRLSH